MNGTQLVKVELQMINCGCCGGTYALNERYVKHQSIQGGSWVCPYCQEAWGFTNDNENSRLKKELAQERKRKEWAQQDAAQAKQRTKHAEHQARAEKAAKTRIKNRIAKGVCPCCNRTFENLSRHMNTKHPEYSHDH